MPAPKAPGFLLGLGLGGFLDGIVLHQVLQWHHILTGEDGGEPMDTVAGLEANTLADGFFHLATWMLVVAGMALALRAWRRGELAPPWRAQAGLLLAGWGVFNLWRARSTTCCSASTTSATTSAGRSAGTSASSRSAWS